MSRRVIGDYSSGIALLFKRGGGRNAFGTRFRYAMHCEFVNEALSTISNGRDELRSAALNELRNSDPDIVIQALFFLCVVGEPEDAEQIKHFCGSEFMDLSDAAATCLFEVHRRTKRE